MKSRERVLLGSLREIVFGFEDGVVSTIGVVTGIAEGTQDRLTILLAGIVVVAVESLSMAAGTYLSSKSEEQALARTSVGKGHARKHLVYSRKIGVGALFMGVAYVVGGLIPVIPYFILPLDQALVYSVVGAVLSLFLLGVWKAKMTKTSVLSSGVEMVLVSLTAAGLGFLIGKVAGGLYPELKSIHD